MPALFRQGFRPFFLAAGLWALAMVALWLPVYLGEVELPTRFGPVAWHAHEMLFGYALAAVAGFLLTAVPNWTGRLPVAGARLAGLAALWLAGRVAITCSAWLPAWLVAVADLALPVALLTVALREIVAGRNWRNLPVVAALAGLALASGLDHAEANDWLAADGHGVRLAIAILVLLISLIGGRVVPSFTRNWLHKRGAASLPASFGVFDRIALAATVLALAAWVLAPDAAVTGVALLVAGAVALLRLARWRGQATGAEPLVWSLHLGFAWVPIGLALTGAAALFDLPTAAGIHALTAGAIGGMTLAVMSRAIRGHTGQPLTADRWAAAMYLLVAGAAIARVAAPFATDRYVDVLVVSALAWCAAFALFVCRDCRAVLAAPRRDDT